MLQNLIGKIKKHFDFIPYNSAKQIIKQFAVDSNLCLTRGQIHKILVDLENSGVINSNY